MPTIRIAIVTLTLILSSCSSEVPTTGEELRAICSAYEKNKAGQVTDNPGQQRADLAACVGFIAGTGFVSQNAGCPPEDHPPGQEVEIVIKYLKKHSLQLHRPASHLVEEALREAWPCKK